MSSIAIFLFVLAAAWGLRSVAGRNGLRDAWRATITTPALLVPAAMTLVACGVLLAAHRGPTLHENPFGVAGARNLGMGQISNWAVFGIVTLALAGHIGVLQAWRAGRRPDGIAFFQGVREHTATVAIGKLALFAMVYAISTLSPGSLLRVLYIVPSLLLAPLIAAAAEHPRRPVAALFAALRIAHSRFETVGNLVFGHVVFLVGTFYAGDRMWSGAASLDLLTFSSSSLSYNMFPFALVFTPALSITLVVANAVASSVFIAGYFQRLGREDLAAPAPAKEPAPGAA